MGGRGSSAEWRVLVIYGENRFLSRILSAAENLTASEDRDGALAHIRLSNVPIVLHIGLNPSLAVHLLPLILSRTSSGLLAQKARRTGSIHDRELELGGVIKKKTSRFTTQ